MEGCLAYIMLLHSNTDSLAILAWSRWKADRCPGLGRLSLMQVTQDRPVGW